MTGTKETMSPALTFPPETIPPMRAQPTFRLASLLMLLALPAACAGPDGAAGGPVGGTVIIGSAADAEALVPSLTALVQGRVISENIFDRLVEMGPDLNVNGDAGFDGRLAREWSWSPDSLVITFRLRPEARWHDGRPVRAIDVLAGYNAIRDRANGSNLASHFGDVDSVSARDSLTVAVHFARRSAEQFYDASQLIPLPAHIVDTIPSGQLRRSAFVAAPVGSGRFRFVSREPNVRVELAAFEEHYRGRPRLDRLVFTVTPEAATGLARVWSGDTDVWEPLAPDDVLEAQRHEHVHIQTGPGFDYGFLQFNFRDPRDATKPHALFADRELRRALSLAIDRTTLVRAVFDTLALMSYGPFTRPQSTADTTLTLIPFDRAAGIAKLDSLGWRPGPDGIRRRGAQRLSFGLHVPTSSIPRNRLAVLLQEQLRQAGVEVRIEAMEFAAMRDQLFAGRFDATIGGLRTTPSPSGIRGAFGSAAISRGSPLNFGKYANTEVDAAIEAGLGALVVTERRAHMRRAYQLIIDDAPAVWLYELRNAAAVHRRINVPRWRSEAWWTTIGDWTIDPAQRLPRDAAPAAPATP
jgi:peptide/nickel transport system substrate-binding protein